ILNEQIDSYDPMGRIAKDWQAAASGSSFELDYGYDKAGDRLSETNGVGVTLGSSFDLAGRPLSLGSSLVDAQHPASLANAVQYNALGQAVSIAMGSGIAETTQYDVRGRLTARNAGSVYQLSGIQYEPDGNLWNVPTESVMGWWSYAYDDLNRLRLSSGPTVNFTYAYDRYGNRWAQNVTAGSGPSFNQAFNGRNQIVGFTYDANGNLTGDGRCNYAYDAENELVDVSACTSATYQYDAEGRRSRTVTGNTEDTVYDLGGRPAAVFGMVNGAPQWWWSEVYLGGRHL